jgi:hypothetical protein
VRRDRAAIPGGLAACANVRILVASCARLDPARKGVVVTLPVGPAEARDDGLFRPSLPEGIDVGTFRSPWRPMSLAVAGFFGGLLAAGALFAMNWSRLDQPQAARRCALLTAGFAVLTVVVVAALIVSGTVRPDDQDLWRNLRLGQRVLAVVFGLWQAREQEPRFRMFVAAGREPAAALLPSLGAIALSIAAEFLLILIAAAVAVMLGAKP